MSRIDTLTAYKCKFSYLQRNNPIYEQQKEAIKAGELPKFTFSEFITTYLKYTTNLAIGKNADRAISLSPDQVTQGTINAVHTWHLIPNSGKQGRQITLAQRGTNQKHNFTPDWAALYENHVFVYEDNDSLYIIFHRQNGSGCKSVFLETANKALRDIGLKLEMDLIIPISNGFKDATPTKITLQFLKENLSSDIADNINKPRKKSIIRDLGLNLEEIENGKVLRILKRLQAGEIDQVNAFALIKAELNDADDYNDAEVKLRIGRGYRKVQWNEFDSIMGTYDITDKISIFTKSNEKFSKELSKLANDYYFEIVASEEV